MDKFIKVITTVVVVGGAIIDFAVKVKDLLSPQEEVK